MKLIHVEYKKDKYKEKELSIDLFATNPVRKDLWYGLIYFSIWKYRLTHIEGEPLQLSMDFGIRIPKKGTQKYITLFYFNIQKESSQWHENDGTVPFRITIGKLTFLVFWGDWQT
jgi:hypothetical protein